MDSWSKRLTKQIEARVPKEDAVKLVGEIEKECQAIAHSAAMRALEIATTDRSEGRLWEVMREKPLPKYALPNSTILLGHHTVSHERMCKLFLELADVEAAEHRVDLWEKIRTVIFKTAGAILYAIVVLGFLYVAKALELSVPLSRIVPP